MNSLFISRNDRSSSHFFLLLVISSIIVTLSVGTSAQRGYAQTPLDQAAMAIKAHSIEEI